MTQVSRQNRHSQLNAVGFVSMIFCQALQGGLARGDEIPSDWAGIRPMGMGNAFTSVGNDDNAVFSNPAGLARSRNPRSKNSVHSFIFPGLVVGGNSQAIKGIRTDASKPKNYFTNIVSGSQKNPQQMSTTEMMAYPSIILGNKGGATFLLGFPARSQNKIQFIDSANPWNAQISSVTTVGAALAIASQSRGGSFTYGLSLRPNTRYSYVSQAENLQNKGFSHFKEQVKNSGAKTTGVGADAGIQITAGDFWLPTLGIAIRNIPTGCVQDYTNPVTGQVQAVCGSRRTGTVKSDAASTQLDPTEIRAGFSIIPRGRIDGNRVNLRLAVDAFPIPVVLSGKSYGLSNINVNQLVHAGAELYFGNAVVQKGFALRAGSNDGQLTYGGSLNLLGISLQYASYSVATGKTASGPKDRRHLLGLSTDW